MASSRDLVLALIHGYDAAAARPFLDSLQRVAPHATIVLACSDISDRTRAELRSRGCVLLPYRYLRTTVWGRQLWLGNTRWAPLHRNYARFINALPLTRRAKLRLRGATVRHFLDPNTRRFVEFFLALQNVLPDFDRVLLSDLRDVVFQANPFEQLQGEGILYGLEDASVTIGSHWANSLWLERVGGTAARDALACERVSCCGVVLASGRVMADYLGGFVAALTQPGVNVANFHGADTGAHNLLVRRGNLPGARCVDFQTGGILNMHGLRPECIRWNDDDQLVDANGRVIPIIHQYDRHPEAAARLFRRLQLA